MKQYSPPRFDHERGQVIQAAADGQLGVVELAAAIVRAHHRVVDRLARDLQPGFPEWKGSRSVIRPPADVQIELVGGTVCSASQHTGIGWERERNPGQVIHTHPCGHGDRHDLDNLDRPVTNNMAAKDSTGRAVGDQIGRASCRERVCHNV